jgi:hypothetical protein
MTPYNLVDGYRLFENKSGLTPHSEPFNNTNISVSTIVPVLYPTQSSFMLLASINKGISNFL